MTAVAHSRDAARTWHRLASTLVPFLAAACTCGAPEKSAPERVEAPVAVFARATGDVRVKHADSEEWLAAREGMALRAEDRIRTVQGASATIAFPSGSTLEVAESSLVTIAGVASSGVRLEKGAVDVDWPRGAAGPGGGQAGSGPPGEFVVETRAARARVSREVVFQ